MVAGGKAIDIGLVQSFGHLAGMVADIGEGDLSAGIEAMRDNHKWFLKQRRMTEKVGIAAVSVVVVAITSGVLGALWLGIKHMLGVK